MTLPDGRRRDTIFAQASAAGRAGISVVRLSGPAAGEGARKIAGCLPAPRRAMRATFRDPGDGTPIDDGLVLWFPAPHSFTGEDVVEFHGHGGRAVLAGLLDALAAIPGCRPAEAGEFSRRAFLNGKLDLTEIEGLADLIAADTAAQRRQALIQMGGALGRLYDGWRADLVRVLAYWEAAIDFPDEELPEDLAARAGVALAPILAAMQGHLADRGMGERMRQGLRVAILGAPNVGKSSLLNALAQRDVAIVSEMAGTTRDVIEVQLDIAGLPITLVDTAGLRSSTDPVEREGIRRSLVNAEAADLCLVLVAADDPVVPPDLADLADRALVVVSKADLRPAGAGMPGLAISAASGEGLAMLQDALADRAGQMLEDGVGSAVPLTRARHRIAVTEAAGHIDRAMVAILPELAAEDLRLALRALGRITGHVDVEELLDVIFRDFCIGK